MRASSRIIAASACGLPSAVLTQAADVMLAAVPAQTEAQPSSDASSCVLQSAAVVIDNINIHPLPQSMWPVIGAIPPSAPVACPGTLLTFDSLTQLGDL